MILAVFMYPEPDAPDAVVCRAARSASAVLAAVGPSVGIGPRTGLSVYVCMWITGHWSEGGRWIGAGRDSLLLMP